MQTVVNARRSLSFALLATLFFSVALSQTVASEENQDPEIQGISTLTIHSIDQSHGIPATWELSISASSRIGADFLPDPHMGVRYQIDTHIGDADGNISQSESHAFSVQLEQSRTWGDAEVAGCCSFDLQPFILDGPISFNSSIIPAGSLEISHTWGWNETADIFGAADGRAIRLLDLPRTGSLVEAVPMKIILPHSWEYRFSAQSSIMTPSSSGFTVDRSSSPVASDIRISLDTNVPPSSSAVRLGGGSTTISPHSDIHLDGLCEDNSLANPVPEWVVEGPFEKIEYTGNILEIQTSSMELEHGEQVFFSMKCTDAHGANSSWTQIVTVDSASPTFSISFQASAGTGLWNDIQPDSNTISLPSGTVLRSVIEAYDQEGDPVRIYLESNRSGGFTRTGTDTLEITEAFYHGQSTNGPHRDPDDRHSQREPTKWFFSIDVQDSVGNNVVGNWTIVVLDDEGPVIVPEIMLSGVPVESSTRLIAGQEILLNISGSYDRLDALDTTSWTIIFDGHHVYETTPYLNMSGLISLGEAHPGNHVIRIVSWDPAGHESVVEVPLEIEPAEGVIFSKPPTIEVSGDIGLNNPIVITASINNEGSGGGSARLCSGAICSPEGIIIPATSAGPAMSRISLAITPDSVGELDLKLIWFQLPGGDEETIDLTGNITIRDNLPDWIPPMFVSMVIVALSYAAIRRWGDSSDQ
mgnify:FL=1